MNALFSVVLLGAHPLVHLNAALNLLAAVLLVIGWMLIRRRQRLAHGRVMIAAFAVSCLFLVSYLVYHWNAGSVTFTHPGAVRTIYLTILASHVVLAAVVPFLALLTIAFALVGTGWRGAGRLSAETHLRFLARHRQLARWTLPIWLYVSVTGVIVYAMLYHLWPPATG